MNEQQQKLDLEQFIKDNNINFNNTGSALNGACVVVSGFALYLDITSVYIIEDVIKEMFPKSISNFEEELRRVFIHAKRNNYGEFWKKDKAKTMYKF